MNTLVTTAIVGTGQHSQRQVSTDTPVDALAAQLPTENAERALLLTAGAWAVYRQAGYIPQIAPAAPAPAASEILPACSANVAHLLTLLLGDHNALLPEALLRMKQVRWRLPHELLPLALTFGMRHKNMRAALLPVLGERGRWLSQFNTQWSWVNQFLSPTQEGLPADAETIWQEGSVGQRGEILQRLRALDPAIARDWLTAVWKQERADAKLAFLAALQTGLTLADEPLLEKALDDRSSNVQTSAASLLARLPDSALAQRMQARADSILDYKKDKLRITLPATYDAQWKRDGFAIEANAKPETRQRVLTQLLASVPPQHWELHFAATPEQLVAAALKNKDELMAILEAWSTAALHSNSTQWIEPLLDGWLQTLQTTRNTHKDLVTELLTCLPQTQTESKIISLLAADKKLTSAVDALPRPWSSTFSEFCLATLQTHVRAIQPAGREIDYEWCAILDTAALALPAFLLDTAAHGWELPEHTDYSWPIQHWERKIAEFQHTLTIRKRIVEEIK